MHARDVQAAVRAAALGLPGSAAQPCADNTVHVPGMAWLTLEGGAVAPPAAPAAPSGAPRQYFRFLSQAWIALWQKVPASSAN